MNHTNSPLRLEQCDYCPYLLNEFCNFFSAFIHDGVDFDSIPFACALEDFSFDGSVIE